MLGEDHKEALEDSPVPPMGRTPQRWQEVVALAPLPHMFCSWTPPTPSRQSGWNLGQQGHLLFAFPAAVLGCMGALSGGSWWQLPSQAKITTNKIGFSSDPPCPAELTASLNTGE